MRLRTLPLARAAKCLFADDSDDLLGGGIRTGRTTGAQAKTRRLLHPRVRRLSASVETIEVNFRRRRRFIFLLYS